MCCLSSVTELTSLCATKGDHRFASGVSRVGRELWVGLQGGGRRSGSVDETLGRAQGSPSLSCSLLARSLTSFSKQLQMFSPGFFKESLGHFRQWLDDLFHESWLACQEADILIESPSTMAGIHVAEALGIPYFRAFTMPWTTTSTYPQAFAAGVDLGPTYNQLSYTLYDSIIWKATAGQVNRWRKNELG